MKNWLKTISIEEELDVISQLEKDEQIVDIWHIVRFAHSSVHTTCDSANRITVSTKSGPEVFVYKVCHSPVRMNCTKNYGCASLIFLLHYKLYCTEMYVYCIYSMYILYVPICSLVV
jgi:hypothetical protein